MLVFFLAEAVTAGLVLFNGFFIARLVGPSGKGDYYLLTFIPMTLMVIGQLGLPQALAFSSARGMTRNIIARTFVLVVVSSVPILLVTLALLPGIRASLLHGIEPALLIIPLLALPVLLHTTFTTGLIVGRQAALGLSVVKIVANGLATGILVILVGILGLGVEGALLAFLAGSVLLAVGLLALAMRVTGASEPAGSTPYRSLLRYGLQLYPGNLMQLLAHRVDVYLLALLIADPAAQLGYYSMAVAMAELVLIMPAAVSTFFFAHVAGTSRKVADSQVAQVGRVTLLLTSAAAIAIVPAAEVVFRLVLPAFEPALPALYVLLPGVVAFALSQVLAGYLAGLDRPGITSAISLVTLAANVVLNLLLIPTFGIVGASAASLIAYSISAIAYTQVAAWMTGARPLDFWIPRSSDISFVIAAVGGMARRIAGARPDRA